jgi:hypothetical protein
MWWAVSSSIPQRHFASSTTPIRNMYWFRRQCPVRAWIGIDAYLVPYRRSVRRPGRAWSNFHVYWPGRSSELESLVQPAASRISSVAGAVGVKFRLAASQTASSATVFLNMNTGYGYRCAEKIDPPRNQLYPPLSSSSEYVPVSFPAHCILSQRRLLTRPPITLELAAGVLLLTPFCPYTWPFEYHCRLLRLLEENQPIHPCDGSQQRRDLHI